MEDWREMGSLKVAGFNEVRIDCPRKNRLVETPNGFGFFRLPLGDWKPRASLGRHTLQCRLRLLSVSDRFSGSLKTADAVFLFEMADFYRCSRYPARPSVQNEI
jgi:hypothetical protein